ncbi:MAG: NHLP family bacteriocin export ABC transporter peptidase/permease/ATPase subunit [Eubacteriales bacterium]|nr:NHLP family bacteriocin export ABC transporter peptidase/permease/ATPase subunit [Eubacteriales bacterium]
MAEKKINSPVSGGWVKVPVVMQIEALECGAASLDMILAYYGKWIPLEQVRKDCGVSRDGSSAKNVLRAARNYGLISQGYRFEPEELKKNGRFPCIIHWNFNHFVVCCGFKGGKAIINDPARGICRIPMEDFDMAFTGICLMFEPSESFQPGGKPKSVVSFAKERLKGARAAIAFVIATTLITSLIGIINPAFTRVFYDRLLTGKNPDWFVPLITCMSVLAAIQIIVSAADALTQLKIQGKMAIIGSTTFLWKVLHMPMEFFSQRMAGDIQQRQNDNASIANSLIGTLAPLVLQVLMMVFYLVVMLRYSWQLTLVGVGSIIIDSFVSRLISAKRVNITRVQMRDAGKLASTTVAGIEMIETIKASGTENGYFERWSGFQASVNTQQMKFARLNATLGMIPTLVDAITQTAVLMMGVWFVMCGSFTIGKITAFQTFLAAFIAPASSLISAGQTIQEMRTQMERIEDVMKYPSDPVCVEKELRKDEDYSKLTGKIELKNVTFGYSPLAQPLIENFSMTLEPGCRVAFVGGSGCGKSTLSKLISGLYQPWSGEILYDGHPITEIDRSVFTGSLAVVDQDIILFEDTIANNIKMWDNTIEDFEMIMAARDAQLHEDIMQRDGGYQYVLTEGGKDFSGGQRQRMEIARVLAQDPTVIIMDEATSALDARTEFNVVKSIKDRGIACIVIAHRLSTIRDCDEIIVLDKGKVMERGTHEQLMALNGLYTQLVTSE